MPSGKKRLLSRVVRGHLHVRPELVFQVGVAPAWKQRSLKTLNPFANDAHAISLTHASPCSSVRMMPAIRSHACRSSSSGFIRHTNGVSLGALERQMK